MTRGVSRGRDGNDPAVVAELPALRERPERLIVEREGLRREPRRQRLAQEATHHLRHRRAQELQLRLVDQDWRAHVDHAVDVVAMGVGEHDLGDVVGVEPRRSHHARELLAARHLHPRERHVACRGGLTRVDQPQDTLVLDGPDVDRQGIGEGSGQEEVQLAPRA
ncbi:MAG TPA: hypothetical protein VH817_13950 [Thermoleophilaceae bacterium]